MSQQEIEQEKLAAIVDQKGQAVVYAKMSIEIGVYYRLAKDEKVLLDAFSLRRQQYVLTTRQKAGWCADTSRPL